MKKSIAFSVGLTFLFAAAVFAGGVGGPKHMKVKVPASRSSEPGEAAIKHEFNGGQRASIVVTGDHRPVVDLKILIFDDATGKLVAQDGGGGDIVGVSWIPPRKGFYRIVIRNPSEFVAEKNPYNDCTVAIN